MQEIADKIKRNLDEFSSLLNSEDFLSSKISSIGSNEEKIVSWSKFNAFSVIPFYNELTGFKNGDMQQKEPKNKKNVYCYLSNDRLISKILSYNSKGVVEDVSYIIREENSELEIKQDINGKNLAISQVFFDEKSRPVEAYYANDDDNNSGYHYFYEGNVIKEILTVGNNSAQPYVILSCEYDNDKKIKEIYFDSKNGKVNVFPR
ncbi:hypothetical protein [Erwinia sp. 198]|uniref:hypothetical protein n=1 Tax=Erwinia sp. 198 TaxID=2022746 RepID=UPI000F67F8D0|nr:hypothetical protein [Erwinia sp. 198]